MEGEMKRGGGRASCRERCRNWDRLTHATQDNRTRYENAFPGFVSCAESRIASPAADRRELYKEGEGRKDYRTPDTISWTIAFTYKNTRRGSAIKV